MAVSHVYPVIDFTQLDYDKIPIGTFLIGFDSSNGGKLCKMDHVGTITIIETGLLPSLTGLNYQGLWNADINFPTLTSSVGTTGDFYIVSVLGTTNLNGVTDWQVGDWAIFEGGAWIKVDNHDIQAYNTVKDESTILPQRSVLKFTGTGVTASDVGGETQVNIPGGVPQAYTTVKEEGVTLPQRSVLKFTGTGVTASDIAGETVVDVPGNIPATNYGLFAQTGNSTPITGTVVETSLINGGVGVLSVPANGFTVGDSFRAVFGGILTCANNQTIQVKVKSGPVILLDSGAQTISNITNDVFTLNIDFTIRQLGIPGVASIVALGFFHYTKTVNSTPAGFAFNTVNNTTFNTTIGNTLDVTIQWGSANVGNNIYSDIFVLNKVY
jgi:hypothetical protein